MNDRESETAKEPSAEEPEAEQEEAKAEERAALEQQETKGAESAAPEQDKEETREGEEAPPEREEGEARVDRRRKPRYFPRRKVCSFCVDKVADIDYKDVDTLRRYLSDRGRIEPRRKTGTCAKHQRRLTIALKRARHLALLPYTADHIRLTGAPSPRS